MLTPSICVTLPRCPFRAQTQGLEFLGGILLLDGVGAGCGALLVELSHRAMELLFEDRLGLDGLKLGLKVPSWVRAGVASAASIVDVVAHVLDLFASLAPISFAAAVLLSFVRILVDVA